MDEIRVRSLVYLKQMIFPDSNTIDYRLNGRPYLVFDIDEENAYLLKISSSHKMDDKCYYKIALNKNCPKKLSYIDLRFLFYIPRQELEEKVFMQYDESIFKGKKKRQKRNILISETDYTKIKEQLNTLASVNTLKALFSTRVNVK